jgi:small-conductance mechanosensitive channel
LYVLHHHHHHAATVLSSTEPTIVGKVWPVVQKLILISHPPMARKVLSAVIQQTDWIDILLLSFASFGLQPLVFQVRKRLMLRKLQQQSASSEVDGSADRAQEADVEDQQDTDMETEAMEAISTPLASVIRELSLVTLSVNFVDIMCDVVFTTLGFTFPRRWNASNTYAKTAFILYGLRRFLIFKTNALCRIYKVSDPNNLPGRIDLVDRLLNALSIGLVSLVLFDWLSVRMGMAVKGIVAFGSIGTLALTLGSQRLVSTFVSGILLQASSKIYPNESVVFGDGTAGTIVQIGWFDTLIRGSDDIVTSIPNVVLSGQKISNLSRARSCQVKQVLRFHYEDADEIPGLLDSIKSEIKKRCPRLVRDGSRPFRVYWTGYGEDYLEVVVDTHHNIPPTGDQYYINRQNVLLAINRAVKDHGIEFAQLYRVVTPASSAMNDSNVLQQSPMAYASSKPGTIGLRALPKQQVMPQQQHRPRYQRNSVDDSTASSVAVKDITIKGQATSLNDESTWDDDGENDYDDDDV